VRINEDPLHIIKREAANEQPVIDEPDSDEEDQIDTAQNGGASATISHLLGQADPLADFHKLENLMLARTEFETWEQKKLRIFAAFKEKTDGREIIIDERRDRDTDRTIRMGKGKSRLDQLELKGHAAAKAGMSKNAQTMSAQDFTA
jgi:hypothetical protein